MNKIQILIYKWRNRLAASIASEDYREMMINADSMEESSYVMYNARPEGYPLGLASSAGIHQPQYFRTAEERHAFGQGINYITNMIGGEAEHYSSYEDMVQAHRQGYEDDVILENGETIQRTDSDMDLRFVSGRNKKPI